MVLFAPSNASIAQQASSNASISCPSVPPQRLMTKPDQNKEQLTMSFLTSVTLDIHEKLQALDKDPTQALNRNFTEQTKQELQGLAAPLQQVSDILSDDNPENDSSACNRLDVFIRQVDAAERSGDITEDQADDLRTQAEDIRSQLEC